MRAEGEKLDAESRKIEEEQTALKAEVKKSGLKLMELAAKALQRKDL